MDPVTIIVAAVAAGAGSALSDAVNLEIKAAYEKLRAALSSRFGSRRGVTHGVERLEQEPDNPDRRDALSFALSDEDAGSDAELVGLAQSVLDAAGATAGNVMSLGRNAAVDSSPQRASAGAGASATNKMTLGEGARVTGSSQTADATGSPERADPPAPTS